MKKICLLSLILSSILYGREENANSNAIQLNKSVISTSGFETTARNTVKNVIIISGEELHNKSYIKVTDVLRDVPGLRVFRTKFGNIVDLRGQGISKIKSNVQVMVDGVNINPLDPAHGSLSIDAIPLENIERIEILPGGGSVIYGNGTVGGAINIITKLKAQKVYNEVGIRTGSYNTNDYKVAIGQKFNNGLAFQMSYNGGKTKGYRKGDKNNHNYFEGAINYKIDKESNINFKYYRYENKNYTLDSLTKKQIDTDRRQQGKEEPSRNKLTKDSYNLNYQNKLSDKFTVSLDTSYQNTINILGNNRDGLFSDKKTQVSPKLKYQYMKDSEVVVGVDYRKNKATRKALKSGYLGRFKEYEYNMKKDSLGAFVYNKTRVNDFEFIQGYRREESKFSSNRRQIVLMNSKVLGKSKMNKKMNNDAYELGLNYLYSDTGNLYGRFESGFRTPAPTEFVDKPKNETYVENNLKAETYKTFEIGAKDYIYNSFVALTFFYTESKNEIISTGNMPKFWKFENIGKTKRKGVELQLKQEMEKLSISESFSYIDARIVKDDENSKDNGRGKYIPGVSKVAANISLKYNFTANFSTTLATTYKSPYFIDKTNEGGKVNKKFVTDLTINYNFENGINLYAGINNLFDDKYYDNVTREKGVTCYNPAPGRNYFVGVEYTF